MVISEDEARDILLDDGIVTLDEFGLVTAICGNNIGAYRSMLYVRTGYADFDQYTDESRGC